MVRILISLSRPTAEEESPWIKQPNGSPGYHGPLSYLDIISLSCVD
jgi:hypothetical protein